MGLKTRGITVYRNRGYYISPPVMLRNTVTGCYITVMRQNYCRVIDSLALGAGEVTFGGIGLLDRLNHKHGETAARCYSPLASKKGIAGGCSFRHLLAGSLPSKSLFTEKFRK